MRATEALTVFVCRRPGGGCRLVTERGNLVIEADSWRKLRLALDAVIAASPDRPSRVVIVVGRPFAPLRVAQPGPERATGEDRRPTSA
jgi:hypothetical protein